MQRLAQDIELIARLPATVLIQGETGTGKELVARALHEGSPSRRELPFVAVNCGGIPNELVESVLFGHVRGAYTSAHADAPGFVQSAHRGTLFLDEIAELPLAAQTRLLRVLEDKKAWPVGSTQAVDVDVRVVVATHRNLADEVKQGRFREDLFYRINVLPLHVPPLRERGADVIVLAAHWLAELSREYGVAPPALTPDAEHLLANHRWPGNVRELRNAMERVIAYQDWTRLVGEAPLAQEAAVQSGIPPKTGGDWRERWQTRREVQDIEMFKEALRAHQDDLPATAKALGMSELTAKRLRRRAGILLLKSGADQLKAFAEALARNNGDVVRASSELSITSSYGYALRRRLERLSQARPQSSSE